MALSPEDHDFSFPDTPFEGLRKERAEHGTAGYQLKDLHGGHDRMIRMHVEGRSNKDIARELDVTEHTVSYTLRSDLAQHRIGELRVMLDMDITSDKISNKLHDGAINAAQYLVDVVEGVSQGEGASVSEKVKASIELLRFDGYQPTQKIEKKIEHGYMGSVGITHILKRAEEISLHATPVLTQDSSAIVVDVSSAEVEEVEHVGLSSSPPSQEPLSDG